jgi:hypothetical protein
METPQYKTTRVWTKTLKTLRILHALTGESIVSILDRIATQELVRVQAEQEAKKEE